MDKEIKENFLEILAVMNEITNNDFIKERISSLKNKIKGLEYDVKDMMDLRTLTGCGIEDCKWAFEKANGDPIKAREFLRHKGEC